MGHLMVSRCALYRLRDGRLDLLRAPTAVRDLPEGKVKEALVAAGMALLVPLSAPPRSLGFLAVGSRASAVPFSEEDREFAQTLGRQAVAALESVRLHLLGM